jgi:hemerythrin-like metal-binding protein
MEWNENLAVGVFSIDSQHKELISRANAFYASLRTEASKEETLKVLKFLISYVDFHFRDEEALQVKVNYPKYAEHKQLHTDFRKTLHRLAEELESKGITNTASSLVAMTVSNWLVQHIGVQDKAIGKYMKDNFKECVLEA